MVGHLWMVGVGAPCCFCSFGGGGVLLCGGTWASFGWYVVVIVHLFATLLAATWHLEREQ